MVEQATAAAASLRSEASSLAGLIAGFDIGAGESPGAAARAEPVARSAASDGDRENPVHAARARLASFARSGAAVAVATEWEEF